MIGDILGPYGDNRRDKSMEGEVKDTRGKLSDNEGGRGENESGDS